MNENNKAINIAPDEYKAEWFFIASAKKLLENGFLFGKKIDLDDNGQVIAALYVMLLEEQIRNKNLTAEVGYMMDV
jgi:hypothetical protein